MRRPQAPPLTVRVTDDLRAQIDEAAKRAHLTRNAWVVGALRRALPDEAQPASPMGEEATPPEPLDVEGWTDGKPTGERPSDVEGPAVRQARIEQTGSYGYRAIDVTTGNTIEGTVRNMRHAAEAEARRLGYELVDS
jgi:hypothetical protein